MCNFCMNTLSKLITKLPLTFPNICKCACILIKAVRLRHDMHDNLHCDTVIYGVAMKFPFFFSFPL